MVRGAPRGGSTRLLIDATEVSVRLVAVRDFFGSSTKLISVASEILHASLYDNNFPSLVCLFLLAESSRAFLFPPRGYKHQLTVYTIHPTGWDAAAVCFVEDDVHPVRLVQAPTWCPPGGGGTREAGGTVAERLVGRRSMRKRTVTRSIG